jgi:hypothetical protein
VGHFPSPWDFPPHEHAGKGRFDGPPGVFRTLYCSENPLTCLRETLIAFRPSVKARTDFVRFGMKGWPSIDRPWREKRALVSAGVDILAGELVSLSDQKLLVSLESELADLLLERGIDYLTLAEIQQADRDLTQAIARALFSRGAAGMLYPSKFENQGCVALFETRARLRSIGKPRSLAGSLPELEEVCRELSLVLEPDP